MEIVKIENLNEAKDSNKFYELEGRFYALCWSCGKPVRVDHHRTAADLKREDVSEEVYFCDKKCKEDHPEFRDEDDQFVNFNK